MKKKPAAKTRKSTRSTATTKDGSSYAEAHYITMKYPSGAIGLRIKGGEQVFQVMIHKYMWSVV